MLKKILILIWVVFGASQLYAQKDSHFSISVSTGCFANIEDVGVDILSGNNPKQAGAHLGIGTTYEFAYLLASNYWLGVKYMDCDLSYPNNDRGELFWDTDKMLGFGVYAIFLKKSFSKKNHLFDFSGGPLFQDYNETSINYDVYGELEIDGIVETFVSNPQVYYSHFWDIGFFLSIEYKYNVVKNLNIGLKSDFYGLLYIGKQAVTLMPIVEMRF
ncbi:MAG: hypothetical protein PF541_07015 [Prolixibacteraceae bacterium]|jgi:hypothetical protein|nr:hypothetical protein [Prolixibacteraceae bacterium]